VDNNEPAVAADSSEQEAQDNNKRVAVEPDNNEPVAQHNKLFVAGANIRVYGRAHVHT
jgi:hypothetical protein